MSASAGTTVCSGSIFSVDCLLTAQQKRGRSPLDQPSLGEAGDVAAGDDQVVEDSHVDQFERLAQAPRDEFMFMDERYAA